MSNNRAVIQNLALGANLFIDLYNLAEALELWLTHHPDYRETIGGYVRHFQKFILGLDEAAKKQLQENLQKFYSKHNDLLYVSSKRDLANGDAILINLKEILSLDQAQTDFFFQHLPPLTLVMTKWKRESPHYNAYLANKFELESLQQKLREKLVAGKQPPVIKPITPIDFIPQCLEAISAQVGLLSDAYSRAETFLDRKKVFQQVRALIFCIGQLHDYITLAKCVCEFEQSTSMKSALAMQSANMESLDSNLLAVESLDKVTRLFQRKILNEAPDSCVVLAQFSICSVLMKADKDTQSLIREFNAIENLDNFTDETMIYDRIKSISLALQQIHNILRLSSQGYDSDSPSESPNAMTDDEMLVGNNLNDLMKRVVVINGAAQKLILNLECLVFLQLLEDYIKKRDWELGFQLFNHYIALSETEMKAVPSHVEYQFRLIAAAKIRKMEPSVAKAQIMRNGEDAYNTNDDIVSFRSKPTKQFYTLFSKESLLLDELKKQANEKKPPRPPM